jgi:hypothetical protein
VTIRDVLVAAFPYLFYGFTLLTIVSFGLIVVLSLRARRRSSIVQVLRLILTIVALIAVGIVSQRIAIDWVAAVFGLIAGLGVSWWYGRHTVREASLGVNVALIALVGSLMLVSIVISDWLDPRSFLIAGSLVGIRLLVAASPHSRLFVPSRRKADRAIRIATISMLLCAAAAAFFLSVAVAGVDSLVDLGV